MLALDNKRQKRLIYLCFAVYSGSYLAKLNYNALLVEILADLGGSRSVAGLVGSFFFFSYGIGQVVNGFIAKYLNEKYVVTASLLGAGICNFLMSTAQSITVMKYIWLLNGILMSPLWCNIVKVQGKYISEKNLPFSLSLIGMTTSVGTALNYGICALVAAFFTWRLSFRFSFVIMLVAAAVWFLVTSDVERNSSHLPESSDKNSSTDVSEKKKNALPKSLLIVLIAMFSAGAFTQFTREGLNAWVPSILTEVYGMSTTVSIALTLFLPLLSSLGNFLLVYLERKCRDFLKLSVVFVSVSAIFITLLTVCFKCNSFIITFICFIIVSAACAAVANITTNHLPLYYRDRFDSGRMAGIGQGCCYIGSTLSTYTLGLVADNGGWYNVFMLLTAVILFSTVICVSVKLFSFNHDRKHPLDIHK